MWFPLRLRSVLPVLLPDGCEDRDGQPASSSACLLQYHRRAHAPSLFSSSACDPDLHPQAEAWEYPPARWQALRILQQVPEQLWLRFPLRPELPFRGLRQVRLPLRPSAFLPPVPALRPVPVPALPLPAPQLPVRVAALHA